MLKWICVISLATTPFSNCADWNQINNKWAIGGGIAFCGAAAVAFYAWFTKKESNEQLLVRNQKKYDALHNKYAGLNLVNNSFKLENTDESFLLDLAEQHSKELKTFEGVKDDVPVLREIKAELKRRLDSDQRANKVTDRNLASLYETADNLYNKLLTVGIFWKDNASFYSLNDCVVRLSNKYQKYDVNINELMEQIKFETNIKPQHCACPFDYFSRKILQPDIEILIKKRRGVNCDQLGIQVNKMLYFLNGLSKTAQGLSAFFILQNSYNELHEKYKRYNHQDMYTLVKQVNGELIGKKKYPFKSLAEQMSKEIEGLNKAIGNVRTCNELFRQENHFVHSVNEWLNSSQSFCEHLKYIRDTVASLPEYQENVRQCEQDEHHRKQFEQEQERIRVEHEKAQAEQRKADAEHRKAKAEEDRNVILTKEAAAKITVAFIERETQELKTAQARAEAEQEKIKAQKPAMCDQATQTDE